MKGTGRIASALTAAALTVLLAAPFLVDDSPPRLPGPPVAPSAQTAASDSGTVPPAEDTATVEAPPEAEEAGALAPETAAPEADPLAVRAEALLSGMTDWEKVCQLFVVAPESLTGVVPTTAAGPVTKAGLAKYPVGGIVYFSQNLVSPEQTAAMIRNSQGFSRLGLLIAADEEGGDVSRLMRKLGTTALGAMFDYRGGGPETAYNNAAVIAGDMLAFGFNTNFAPVADVWSNRDNTVIGARAYSDDFNEAAVLVAAAVRGYRDSGVACTLKHFPGHGGTTQDSHLESAYVDKSMDMLAEQELLPFIGGIDAGADLVMVGHLTVPALDDVPATVSHTIVTRLLRETLGFGGVVITDGLGMSAVAGRHTAAELAVKAVEAGADLLLCPESLEAAAGGLMKALETGSLTIERIDESVYRILLLKLEHGIIE